MPAKSLRTAAKRDKADRTAALLSEPIQHSDDRKAGKKAGKKEKKQNAKKARHEKVIRDSFTMPTGDYELIGVLKQRCIGLGIAIKKSELLRAGLAAINRLPDRQLTDVVMAVDSVKTGRPPGGKKAKRTREEA